MRGRQSSSVDQAQEVGPLHLGTRQARRPGDEARFTPTRVGNPWTADGFVGVYAVHPHACREYTPMTNPTPHPGQADTLSHKAPGRAMSLNQSHVV